MERTFVMMKPGVLQRRIAGEVLSRFEKKGLTLVAMKMFRLSEEQAKKHYAEHVDKPFFQQLIQYIISGPVIAMAFEGDNAVAIVRQLCGATKVSDAQAGTIRGDYALHTNVNIVHASDSTQSAARELALFFAPQDFFAWEDGNHAWF